jgi:predicted small metal-binding protein
MSKELRCRDIGFDCEAVVTAESDDEVMTQVVTHGKGVHGLTDDQLADPDLQQQVRGQIHERTA